MNQYSPSISKNVPKIVPNIRAAHFHKPSAQHRLSGLFLQRSVVDALKKSLKNYFCSKYFIECLEIQHTQKYIAHTPHTLLVRNFNGIQLPLFLTKFLRSRRDSGKKSWKSTAYVKPKMQTVIRGLEGGPGGSEPPPRNLADQLTLFKLGEQIMPITLLNPCQSWTKMEESRLWGS